MSFSRRVKLEITENKPMRLHQKHAMAYGLFLYSNRFDTEEISLRTRQKEVAETFVWLAQSLLGPQASVKTKELTSSVRPTYRTWIAKKQERRQLIELLEEERKGFAFLATGEKEGDVTINTADNAPHAFAFIAGAFLACGNITDPKKSYHLEFVVKQQEAAESLGNLLAQYGIEVRTTERRSNTVLYCKEVAAVQDLLTMMGASKASLELVEVEMIKDVRNTVNRQTNCETANISKQVSASMNQQMDIQLIEETLGLESLSLTLQETAALRRAHPEASLNELVELSPTPVSRSGLYHRLASLGKTAEDIRQEQKRSDKKETLNA